MNPHPLHQNNYTGKAFAAALRGSTAAQRAALAAQLCNGTGLNKLTPAQSSLLASVGYHSTALAMSATPAEAAALLEGRLSLWGLRKAHAGRRKAPTNAAIIRTFVEHFGAAAVLDELDAMTAPKPIAD